MLGYMNQKQLESLLASQRESGPGLKDVLFEMKLVDEAHYASLQIEFLGKTADALV